MYHSANYESINLIILPKYMHRFISRTLTTVFIAVGLSSLTSCFDDKENAADVRRQTIERRIIGKWMISHCDGKATPTNEKAVITFESESKAFMSLFPGTLHWEFRRPLDVEILDGSVKLLAISEGDTTQVLAMDMRHINDKEILAAISIDGKRHEYRWKKVQADYSDRIAGIWDGRRTSDQSVYDEGHPHRWQYLEDGTYRYYTLDKDGNWNQSENLYSYYFVDGNLLCTRWAEASDGIDHREMWEIQNISDGIMDWTALRRADDGSTYTATFGMTCVYEVDLFWSSGQ